MLGMDLQTLWFFLLGALITGYAILDGFDLGVGLLQPFVRGDTERRLVLNSIGPLWDGNEVWLVTFGGALFAAFPVAYATFLSACYLPFMVLMVSLIGRAISIEFRSKAKSRLWRSYWDYSFALSSFCVVFLFGVAAGNVMEGMPLVTGPNGVVEFRGGLGDLLGPYALSVGGRAVLAAAMHGALYLQLKTEGELQARVHRWAWTAFGLFLVAYFGETVATLEFVAAIGQAAPRAAIHIEGKPDLDVVIPGGVHGDVATSAVTLNALASLLDSAPGLHTMLSIRTPHLAVAPRG